MKQPILPSILTICFLVSACDPELSIEFEARTESLEVHAAITAVDYDFDEGKATYRADANISNTTDSAQVYSNKWLWLESGNSLKSRAYLDSIASHQIDVGSIEIGPNEDLNLEVYWVFLISEIEAVVDDPFILVLRPES